MRAGGTLLPQAAGAASTQSKRGSNRKYAGKIPLPELFYRGADHQNLFFVRYAYKNLLGSVYSYPTTDAIPAFFRFELPELPKNLTRNQSLHAENLYLSTLDLPKLSSQVKFPEQRTLSQVSMAENRRCAS